MDTKKLFIQDSLRKGDATGHSVSSLPVWVQSAGKSQMKGEEHKRSALLPAQKAQMPKAVTSTISTTASSQARSKSRELQLPDKTLSAYANDAEESTNLNETYENVEAHDKLVRLISLPTVAPKSSMPEESGVIFSFDEPATRFPTKNSSIILKPKKFNRDQISSECVLMHSFILPRQHGADILPRQHGVDILYAQPSYTEPPHSQQHHRPSTSGTPTRQQLAAKHNLNSVVLSEACNEKSVLNSHGLVVDNAAIPNTSTLVVTEKNSNASVFVQRLMSHISTKIAASSGVSMMSQKSVVYADKDGRTETSTLKEFSHGAAGLQLAFVAKLDNTFQMRKYFLYLKEYSGKAKFQKHRQALQKKFEYIRRIDRSRLQQAIDNEFGAVLTNICHESTLALIRCNLEDAGWSRKSLKRYFSFLTEQSNQCMLQACVRLSSLLKDQFDIKNRSLSDTKQRMFLKLLRLKKENEAHFVAAADLFELAAEFVDVIRYMIAWVHKILINILQSLTNHFLIHHVDAKSSLSLVCSWSVGNEMILSPDISKIAGTINSGINVLHYVFWNIFKTNCGSVLLYESFQDISPNIISQMDEMKHHNSAFETNCFMTRYLPEFVQEFECSFEQIINIVKSDALSAVSQAKMIEIEIGTMKSIPVDNFATVCQKHFQAVQDSFKNLDFAPSDFHQLMFSLNIKKEFSTARQQLQRVWESQFAQLKQRFRLQIESLAQRINKIVFSLRSIELNSKRDDELIKCAYQLHEAISRAEVALPQMQMEKKLLLTICVTIISCSSDAVVQYWEDFDTYVHFKAVIEEIARAKMSMMQTFDSVIAIFDSGQDEFSKKLRSLNFELEEIDSRNDFSAQCVVKNYHEVKSIVEAALENLTLVAALLENYTMLCDNAISKPKGKHSEIVLRRTPQDIFFVATILAEKSQSALLFWEQILVKSTTLEKIFQITYENACRDFSTFEKNLHSVQMNEDELMENALIERFLSFHSESIFHMTSLCPFLKISIPEIRIAAFKNVINVIFPLNSAQPDTSVTFGAIIGIWQSADEEQKLLIRERIEVQTAVAEKVNLAQSLIDAIKVAFIWKTISAFQEVRFPQYSGQVAAFVNPEMSNLIALCETYINKTLDILLSFERAVDETPRIALSQFLEDIYVLRLFFQTLYACSYWCCCMLTITFERKGDEDQEEFLAWGGNPDQLDVRNMAIKSYKLFMSSFFQRCRNFINESLFGHLSYIRQACATLEDVASQMRDVYNGYRDFTFFPMSLTWFPSIILVEEDVQDASILCLGPAGSSAACRCFSTLMKAAQRKLFANVSHVTKDKEFGQPSTLTTLCGRSISVESSTHLFGRSIHLSLLLQARSVKNAFKKLFLQTIHRFNHHENSSFSQLLSSTNLKDHFIEAIVLASLVKLSSVETNNPDCCLVSELLESERQVAKDAANGYVHSAAALASLVIIRDACSAGKFRTACRWKFNSEDQSLRIEVGPSISVHHNLEVSPDMNWLMLLACDDSYLIRCLQAVALSPRALETEWNHREHSFFTHNLACLTGKQLSIRDRSSKQMPFWIDAISASKGFGIVICGNDALTTFPLHQFLANVLKIGSVFWWASKSLITQHSDIPNVLSSSTLLPFLNFSEFEEAIVQLDCIYRTFRITPPHVEVVRSVREIPSHYGTLLKSFDKVGCKLIPCSHGQNVVLTKEFVISRANATDSCYEHFSKLSLSNAKYLLSPSTTVKSAHETIALWIRDCQKIVISGRSLSGKSTLISGVLREFAQSGSTIQRFFWNGLLPTSSSISPDELEFIQFDVLNKFYSHRSKESNAIAWLDCQDLSTFPSQEACDLNITPLIIETQSISHLDPASLCTYNHYFLAEDEIFCAKKVLLESIAAQANECMVRKSSAQKLVLVQRINSFFNESLKFVHQHCHFSHNLEFSDMHFVKNFIALMKSYCLQMTHSRCTTFGPSWWKKYNVCSETAFCHMSVFCTIWSIGGCLPQRDQENYDVWARTLGFEILSLQSLVNLKIPSVFNCVLSSCVASNGLRLEHFQDYELLEHFVVLGDTGLFCPSPKHFLFQEIIRSLNTSGQTIALLGPSESGKSLFLKSMCKQVESSKTVSSFSYAVFVKASGSFQNIKKLANSFRDSSETQASFIVIIDDFHCGFASSELDHETRLEASQVYGIIRSVICSRTICLVDRVKPHCFHSISLYREPILPSLGMIFGVSTSAPQYSSPLLYSILSCSFLLHPHSIQEQTFQVICSRAVDLKLRQRNRTSTPIVEFSVPIMSSVLFKAHEILVSNMKRLLLPHYYDTPSYSYFASTLLRLVDTFGCTLKENDRINDGKKTKTNNFLAYVRAATSGIQKAKQAVANKSQDEYYLDPSSVWKAFAILFRDLVSHFLSSHAMFEIERMLEESYYAEVNKMMVTAMHSVGCDHGGQLDAILSPIAKYILGSEPDPNASFILKSLPNDVGLQSYDSMWTKYVYDNQEFKFKFMLGMIQQEQNIAPSLSQLSGAFHQLAHFLKFQDPFLRIKCYEGADFLNLVELCESLKVFRYFSVRHVDILDDAKANFRCEIRDCFKQDLCVLFAVNLQFNRYLDNLHVTAVNIHRALLEHFEILHAMILDKKPSCLFDAAEILAMANHIHGASSTQKILSLETATEMVVADFSKRFRFVIAVDANPRLQLSMHDDYFVYKKLRSNSAVCSLFAVSLPTTFYFIRLFHQYNSFEVACKNWKESNLSVAGIPVASFKMQITGYLLLTASILNHCSLNSIFEFPYVSKFLQRNLELCNMVCVKSVYHMRLFREQFSFCIDRLQQILKGINTVIEIHVAADGKAKRLKSELLEKHALLEEIQAKYKLERNVFQQTSNESDQVPRSRQPSFAPTGPIRVSSLFSSSSYGSSILETSRCLNEIQKLSDVEMAKAAKAVQEPKHVEERLISELFVTIFQYTQMGLTAATFSQNVAEFKYRLAALSILQLPTSSLEIMMRFIRNPVLELNDNPFYINRKGLKVLMEWIQSIACQVYTRKKTFEIPLLDDVDTKSWVASVLKKHAFLDDAANALKDKTISSIDEMKCRIQELQSELDPLNLILKSIKSMEPMLQEIKSRAKVFLRKLFVLEQFCEEISYMYSLIVIVCLPFCRENQDLFFDVIKDLTSDESMVKVGTVFNTIISRFLVAMSLENPLSFQFLHSSNLRDFIALCVTILHAKDAQFLFRDDLCRFADSQTEDDTFEKHAVAAMSCTKVILVLKDPFSNKEKVPTVDANTSISDLRLLIKRNEVVFSNTISCCSELAKFCEIADQIVQNSEENDAQHVRVVPISTNSTTHDPLYSMESIHKIKEHGSQFEVLDEGKHIASDLFRLVLPINASSVLKSIPMEGIPMTGFQIINCYDFEKRFTNALNQCLMNCVDKKMLQDLSNTRCSLSEFTSQKLSSLNAICSQLYEISDFMRGIEDHSSAASSIKIAETIARSAPFAKSYKQLAPLLDTCIESLGPGLHFESNWREISRIITSSVIWLLSGTSCIASLKGFDWKESVPKAFLLLVKKSPPQLDQVLIQNYRGNQALMLANQITHAIGNQLRDCVSKVAFECSVFFDIVENLIDMMTTNSKSSDKRTLVESFECANSLPFCINIVHASYFYKLQLSMGIREFELSQNSKLEMTRSFWSFKQVVHQFMEWHPDIDLNSNPEYEIIDAPPEIRSIFILLHVLTFQDTQLDKYDIENPMISAAEFKISAIPEFISAKRLFTIRFMKILLADDFDVFTENLRLLNTRHSFVEEFLQIQTEVLMSLLKRQPFSENDTLVSLLRGLFVPTFDSPYFGFLTAFLLGSTSLLAFIATYSSLKSPAIPICTKQCEKDSFFADLWNENCAVAFNCHTKIEVQVAKDSITKQLCSNYENPEWNHRVIKVSASTKTEVTALFKNLHSVTAEEKLVFIIEDLSSQSWLWTECSLLSMAIQQLANTPHCNHKIVCFLQPYSDSPRHVSEVRAIFASGSKSSVHDIRHTCASLKWHVNALPFTQSRLLKALAVIQWILHNRLVLRAGNVTAHGHSAAETLVSYKGPINSLCATFESLESNHLSTSVFVQLLCGDLLSNGVHEYDVLLYRQLFLDFVNQKIDFHDENAFDSLFAAAPSSRSFIFLMSEHVTGYLEINVLRPAFFGLCSKQVDVPFFNENMAHIPKAMKADRGKCLELKTKLQTAVNDVSQMLPDTISEQKWISICSDVPSHLFPELHAFLKFEGSILITSLNAAIHRILESTSNISRYVKNENEMTFAVNADAGHLNLGIVPLSWDQHAASVFVQYLEYLGVLQSQKKIFDFVCIQLENLKEMTDEMDQRLTFLSASVAVRSFAAYVVPDFAAHLVSSNQHMMLLLGKTTRLSSIQQWMITDSDEFELLFWTPKHCFANQLRREVLSPSTLNFESIKQFIRDALSSGADLKMTNEDPCAITAFFGIMLSKPLSQFFIYDKVASKSRPCGQNLHPSSGASSCLSETTQIFHQISEVLFLIPNVYVRGSNLTAVMQDHLLCPLFRTPTCGMNVHKNLQHVFNEDSVPILPTRHSIEEAKQRINPLLNILFPSADSFSLVSSMAATVMFRSKVPAINDQSSSGCEF